jgi:hypothetical protein
MGSIQAWLGGVEVIQVNKVTWTAGSPLHPPKVLKHAYCDCHVCHLDVDCACLKLGVGQYTLETLDHIE